MNLEYFKQKIDLKKIISFDIFDTLIERKIQNPDHVYDLVQNSLVNKYGEIMNDYAEVRKHAQQLAKHSQYAFGREDASLTQICDYAVKFYPNLEITSHDLRTAEEDIERMLLKTKNEGYQLYKYCLDCDKKIYLTSDMYLSRDFLINILSKLGYDSFENLYVSGDVGLLKHNAKLFEWLLMENNHDLNDVLHIGDNIHTDYNMPKSVGLDAIHFYSPANKNSIEYIACNQSAVRANQHLPSSIAISLYCKYLNENKKHVKNNLKEKYFYMLGLSFIGPICNYLCNWMHKDMQEKKITKVLFFSRDGHVLYKCFKLLYPEFECEYVYASRRMTCYTVGMLRKEKYVNDYMHGILPSHNLQESLSSLPENISVLFNEQHKQFSLTETCTARFKRHLRKFLNDNFDLIQSSYQNELGIVSEYYKECCQGHKNVAVFDLGWRGNMQIGFEKILDKSNSDTKTHGYYFGLLFDSVNSHNKSNWQGIFVHLDRPREIYETLINGTPVMEYLFSTDHPSVSSVKKDPLAGTFIPVFEESSTTTNSLDNNHKFIHEGVCEFVTSFKKHYESIEFDELVSINSLTSLIRSFLLHPKRMDGEMFAKAAMSSGVNQAISRPIVDYPFKTNNPRALFNREKNSLWKEGFVACINKKRRRLIELYSFIRNL